MVEILRGGILAVIGWLVDNAADFMQLVLVGKCKDTAFVFMPFIRLYNPTKDTWFFSVCLPSVFHKIFHK